MNVSILSLHSYPVKSCAGIAHTQAGLGVSGLSFDRQWVVVDGNGRFMTQRTCAKLALIQPSLSDGGLTLNAPEMPPLHVGRPEIGVTSIKVPVRIFSSDTLGADEGDLAAHWLGAFLETPCRLLRLHPDAARTASPAHVDAWRAAHRDWVPGFPARHVFGFADGFPFLVTNQASLDELNEQLRAKGQPPVPMNRFRPNIVLQGLPAYEEDMLFGLRIGPLRFAFVKPCGRCPVPNIDQETAITALEPGLTLAENRRFASGVLFGVNAVVAGASQEAQLAVGDNVEPYPASEI
ncbi:MAG TPA: MOSC N-terminal beta barrel domain-containing protein [Candidimonas sp.]|nr:MOSC N-terminal beta barrel domain-containing protein [Candidimonas sp.]